MTHNTPHTYTHTTHIHTHTDIHPPTLDATNITDWELHPLSFLRIEIKD
jgi:hypothetical protein